MKDGHRAERENRRRARIGFRDESGPWYALDNAAVIMPANSDAVSTSLFRFSARLDERVHLPSLEAALARVVRRFPYFAVELRKGVFWHYLEPCVRPPRVISDVGAPCMGFNMHRRGTCLFRVRVRGRVLACEFAHILTDGTGGIRFLKNLLVEYFRFRGVDPDGGGAAGSAIAADPDLYDLDSIPDPEELEDAYNRYFPGDYPHPESGRPAFHVVSRLLERGSYRVTEATVPLPAALAAAKALGISLTELLVAVNLDVLQELWFAAPPRERRGRTRIAVEVPVNMRKFHETASNRNFSLFVHAEQDMRLGRREFPDIARRVHHFLRYEIDKPSMARHIARNVRGGRLLAIGLVPLPLKTPLMRLLYAYYGDNKVSGVMSNLGAVSLPAPVAARVESLSFVPATSPVVKTKLSVLSWKDRLVIAMGSLARSREFERLFAARLRSLGLPVRIDCNYQEGNP